MKLLILSAAVVVAMASARGPVPVAIENYAFKAPTVTVPVGSTVVWRNSDDDPHTVTAENGSFDSKGLANGDSYRHTFVKPGRYAYRCALHPFMRGVVVVRRAGK
jgi:plastocyanin